jgi:hypothetical protein
MRLSPSDPFTPFCLHGLGRAYYYGGDYPAAVAAARQLCRSYPSFQPAYRTLVVAACYAHMGRLDEVRAIVAHLRTITPVVVPDFLPWRNAEHRELLLSGLRLATAETE